MPGHRAAPQTRHLTLTPAPPRPPLGFYRQIARAGGWVTVSNALKQSAEFARVALRLAAPQGASARRPHTAAAPCPGAPGRDARAAPGDASTQSCVSHGTGEASLLRAAAEAARDAGAPRLAGRAHAALFAASLAPAGGARARSDGLVSALAHGQAAVHYLAECAEVGVAAADAAADAVVGAIEGGEAGAAGSGWAAAAAWPPGGAAALELRTKVAELLLSCAARGEFPARLAGGAAVAGESREARSRAAWAEAEALFRAVVEETAAGAEARGGGGGCAWAGEGRGRALLGLGHACAALARAGDPAAAGRAAAAFAAAADAHAAAGARALERAVCAAAGAALRAAAPGAALVFLRRAITLAARRAALALPRVGAWSAPRPPPARAPALPALSAKCFTRVVCAGSARKRKKRGMCTTLRRARSRSVGAVKGLVALHSVALASLARCSPPRDRDCSGPPPSASPRLPRR
jgi:hypothetical protein